MRSHFLRAVPKGSEGIEFVSSSSNRVSNASSNTVNAPSGIQEGDILVAVWRNPNSAAVSSVPSGWSLVAGSTSNGGGFFVYSKTATSSEPSSYVFTLVSTQNNTIGIVAYRNATSIAVTGSIQANSSTNTITAPSITLSNEGVLVACMTHDNTFTISTPPSGMTNRVSNYLGPSINVYDLLPSGTGVTGNKTASVSPFSVDTGGLLIQLT